MKLSKYNDKRVRIIDIKDDIYEGIVFHNSLEYNQHEFGFDKESLQMGCLIFFKDDIKKINTIDKYSNKYSKLEEDVFNDGMDLIDEILYGEEEEHVYRLLTYIKDHIDKISYKEELNKLLKEIINYYDNEEINNLIIYLLNK